MLEAVRAKLGWIGLAVLAAGLAGRLVPWVRERAGWLVVWIGLAILVVFVAVEWRQLVASVTDRWVRARTFLGQVRSELERVTWPSRREVSATTFVVIVTSVFFGVYLYSIDLLLSAIVRWIFRALGAA